MVTITEWNKDKGCLEHYTYPRLQYIEITKENWYEWWGRLVEVWDAGQSPKEKRLLGWCTYVDRPICSSTGIQYLSTWEYCRVSVTSTKNLPHPQSPYGELEDWEVMDVGSFGRVLWKK